VSVLVGSAGRGAREVVAVKPGCDCPVALAVEVFGEDPAHDLGGRFLDGQDAKPVALGCLAGIGMGSTVEDQVAVWRAAALMATLVDHLGIHCGTDSGSHVLAL
jgi:hypothetical protein